MLCPSDNVILQFLAEQIELLLETAKKNRMAGARLMPVFCAALTYADELQVPKALQDDIIRHIEYQRQIDGFAIKDIDQDGVPVVAADDIDE